MEINITIEEGGRLPEKMSKGAAAFDCFAREINYDDNFGFLEIKLGFRIAVPDGYMAKIFPRSSVTNKGLSLGNSVGIIDSDFRGEVRARFYPNPSSIFAQVPNMKHTHLKKYCEGLYNVGDACAQMIIEKLEDIELTKVEQLNETKRGEGGFGSTDNTSKD